MDSFRRRKSPHGAGAGWLGRALAVAGAALGLLALLATITTPAGATTTFTYNHSAAPAPTPAGGIAASGTDRLDTRVLAFAGAASSWNHDDLSNLARTSTRSGAEVVAPNTARPTFRGDSRPPSEVFNDGFEAVGGDMDLLRHAEGYPNSGYVSTSTSPTVARDFGPNVYEVRAPGGIDLNATLGARSPFPNELEIAFPGRVQSCHIVGCTTASGRWVPNPGYGRP